MNKIKLSLFTVALSLTGTVQAAECDRSCLINTVDNYFKAMVAHDPTKIKVTPHAVFVENVEKKKLGEGLWKTISALPNDYRIYVPDPTSQQVGFFGLIEDAGKPALIALRLKLAEGKISEAEHLIANNLAPDNLKNLQKARPAFTTSVPEIKRNSRDKLIEIAYTYYDAVNKNDGNLTPFAQDCVRHENGAQTTGNSVEAQNILPGMSSEMAVLGTLGCGTQLSANTMGFIDAIDNRRVEIADVETGLVFGLSHFRHSMNQLNIKVKGMPGVESFTLPAMPAFDLPAAHIYKISEGKQHEIEAMGITAPYLSASGW